MMNYGGVAQALAETMKNMSTEARKKLIEHRLNAAYAQGIIDAKQEIRDCLGIEYRD